MIRNVIYFFMIIGGGLCVSTGLLFFGEKCNIHAAFCVVFTSTLI